MLFPPQREERIGQPAPVRLQPVNSGVAGRAKRDQPGAGVPSGLAVMDGLLVPCPAAPAAVAVPCQDGFPMPAEPPSGVRGLAVAAAAQPGDGGLGPAPAEQAWLGGIQQGSV